MKKSILILSCFIVTGVFAQNTTTTTTFSKLSGVSTDKYGIRVFFHSQLRLLLFVVTETLI